MYLWIQGRDCALLKIPIQRGHRNSRGLIRNVFASAEYSTDGFLDHIILVDETAFRKTLQVQH